MTYCPSRPAIGDVLTPKIIDTVGSSIAIGGIGIWMLGVGDRLADRDVLDAREADDVAGGRLLDVDALQPVEGVQLRDLASAALPQSSLQTATASPIFTRPLKMRPMAMRPR